MRSAPHDPMTPEEKRQPQLRFVLKPISLPPPPAEGRVVMLDVAFVAGADVDKVTLPWIGALGERLAGWVDHHTHPAWVPFEGDPRFVLVPRQRAPACPELITPDLVARFGAVDWLFAHADFDGCMSAAKFLRGGQAPYPEADEDARAIDSPGKGFVCSERGERLDLALDQASEERPKDYPAFCAAVVAALVQGAEPADLTAEIDAMAQRRGARAARLRPLAEQAVRLHPQVLLLRVEEALSSPDKVLLLKILEAQALVGIVREPGFTTVASFHDDLDGGFHLCDLEGLRGFSGYAWGPTAPERLLAGILAQMRDVPAD